MHPKYLITKKNSQADCEMVDEARKQSIACMETDYSKHTHFRRKITWRLVHLGALGVMGETVPLTFPQETTAFKRLSRILY